MTKKVTVIYDNTRIPDRSIRSITGKKGFGDTIFKRITLKERMKSLFTAIPCVSEFVDSKDVVRGKIQPDTHIFMLYSDFVIKDIQGVETLLNKVLYAHETYCVMQNDRVVGMIFETEQDYFDAGDAVKSSYTRIDTDCFADISDVTNFRQFITSGFEARFFNSLSGDEYTVVKSSDNKEKLKAEYMFYSFLPEDMKQWFVRPYDYQENDEKASYKMQRYHMTDLAIRYIHGAIGFDEFNDILDKLFHFIKGRNCKEVSSEEYEEEAKKLYLSKVYDRVEKLKTADGYDEIAGLISSLTPYGSIDEIVEKYRDLYEKIRGNRKFVNLKVACHGDLCFSNILYSNDASFIIFIDPKGAVEEDGLYMDPYYDIAKLSHSICGHYDFFNSDLYEIVVDEKLKAHLTVDVDNRAYVDMFRQKLVENDIDLRLIRLYETSLFLSMLPLHMDRPKKVFAFILNALAIMDSLEEV